MIVNSTYIIIIFLVIGVILGIILWFALKPKKVTKPLVDNGAINSMYSKMEETLYTLSSSTQCSKIIDLKKELKLNESIFILNFYDNNILEKNYQADADRKLIKAQLDLKYFVEIWPQEFIDYISTTNNAADIKVIDEIKTFDKDTIKIPNSFLTFAVMKSFVDDILIHAGDFIKLLDNQCVEKNEKLQLEIDSLIQQQGEYQKQIDGVKIDVQELVQYENNLVDEFNPVRKKNVTILSNQSILEQNTNNNVPFDSSVLKNLLTTLTRMCDSDIFTNCLLPWAKDKYTPTVIDNDPDIASHYWSNTTLRDLYQLWKKSLRPFLKYFQYTLLISPQILQMLNLQTIKLSEEGTFDLLLFLIQSVDTLMSMTNCRKNTDHNFLDIPDGAFCDFCKINYSN